MDVEVEVARCVRTTYLVQGVRSLEAAEEAAMDAAAKKLAGASGLRKTSKSEPESWVTWSRPVVVKDGEVLR